MESKVRRLVELIKDDPRAAGASEGKGVVLPFARGAEWRPLRRRSVSGMGGAGWARKDGCKLQGLGIYIGRGFHCLAHQRADGRGQLLINAMNEEMPPNVVARQDEAWLLGSQAASLRRRHPQLVEVDPLGRLLAGQTVELAQARLEARDLLALIIGQALQTAQQRLADRPQTLALALSPEVWPCLRQALEPAARQAQVALAGAWPASLAEAAAQWSPEPQAEPRHYLHLHAGGQALYAQVVRAQGDRLDLLASLSLPQAGGQALREVLVQWALQRVRDDMGLEGQGQPRFLAALQNSAEVALGDLERFGSGCLVVMGGLRGREGEILDLELDLDLNDYRQLAVPRMAAVRDDLGRFLVEAGLAWESLSSLGLRLRGLEAPLMQELLLERLGKAQRFSAAAPLGQSSALAAAKLATGQPWRINVTSASAPTVGGVSAPVAAPPLNPASQPSVAPAGSSPSQAVMLSGEDDVSFLASSSPSSLPSPSHSAKAEEGPALELLEDGTQLLPASITDSNGLEMPPPQEAPAGWSLGEEIDYHEGPEVSTDPQEQMESDTDPGLEGPDNAAPGQGLASRHPEAAPPLALEAEPPAPAPLPEAPSSWRPVSDAAAGLPASDQPETVAGRYLILEVRSRESYATQYRARDLQSGGMVLIKLFATNKEPAKQAFARAMTVRHIRHPNLDGVLDLGPHGRGMFITLADEGRLTVREVMRRRRPGGPLPLGLALRVMQGLGEALRAIHLIQLSHRNVKPEKVRMLENGPGLWLGGFELCQFTPPGLRVRAAAGTPNYMAPEVWRGEPVCASDIFAAAVFFYEMVTGRLPFAGRNPRELEEAIKERRPLPPTEHNQLLPKVLDGLILRGLTKDPGQRVLDWAGIRALIKARD